MPVLSSKNRNMLKLSSFGLQNEKKYQITNKSHAANAKARAAHIVKKGRLSLDKKLKIDTKAKKNSRKK